MRFAPLSEFIVPIMFLAIWAVTWIFNRESQSLSPRSRSVNSDDRSETGAGAATSRPRGEVIDFPSNSTSVDTRPTLNPPPRPARPGTGVPGRPAERPLASWTETRESISQGGKGLGRESLPAAIEAALNEQKQARPRRPNRGKNSSGQAARPKRPPETPKTRELTEQISSSMSQVKGKHLELKPLNLPLTPLQSLPLPQSGITFMSDATTPSAVVSTSALAPTGGMVSPMNLAQTLADPARLREVFIWNELLQPPVALRRRHRA